MNYYCTTQAIPIMNTLTPEEIRDLIDEDSYPDGCVLITDGWKNTCITKQTDLKPSSSIIKYGDFFTVIEYFENGIPEWLDPVPGLVIHSADWENDHWEYTNCTMGAA